MANSADHALVQLERKLHSSDPNDQACLNGYHNGNYTPDDACSYRWQAHEIGKEADRGIFDDRSDLLVGKVVGDIKTTPFPSGFIFSWYHEYIPAPTVWGDWWLDGPHRASKGEPTRKDFRKRDIPDGENFTRAYWPYWFNAHHIIPKGLFATLISGASKAMVLLRCSLLLAKYNINGKRNMLILPMDREIASLLELPRHLGLLSWRDSRNHPDYNDYVKGRLTPIIDDFKQLCDQEAGKEDHGLPDAELTKDQLIALSDSLYEEILGMGRGGSGAQLDTIG